MLLIGEQSPDQKRTITVQGDRQTTRQLENAHGLSGVWVPSPRTVDWVPLYNSACGKDPKQRLHRSSGQSLRSNYDAGLSHEAGYEPTQAASDVVALEDVHVRS